MAHIYLVYGSSLKNKNEGTFFGQRDLRKYVKLFSSNQFTYGINKNQINFLSNGGSLESFEEEILPELITQSSVIKLIYDNYEDTEWDIDVNFDEDYDEKINKKIENAINSSGAINIIPIPFFDALFSDGNIEDIFLNYANLSDFYINSFTLKELKLPEIEPITELRAKFILSYIKAQLGLLNNPSDTPSPKIQILGKAYN
jgi:hypothetical protein